MYVSIRCSSCGRHLVYNLDEEDSLREHKMNCPCGLITILVNHQMLTRLTSGGKLQCIDYPLMDCIICPRKTTHMTYLNTARPRTYAFLSICIECGLQIKRDSQGIVVHATAPWKIS